MPSIPEVLYFLPETLLRWKLVQGRDGRKEQGMASFDGGSSCVMETGDRIVIERAVQDTRIIKISNISFLETLRKKMS